MFANPLGLWMLTALGVLLIIYFRRPQSNRRILPSLMFLLGDKQHSKQFRFLKTFLANLLLIVQILAVLALALVPAEPFLHRPHNTKAQHTVIVIDTSASMQAKAEGLATRWDKALAAAKDELTRTNTVIAAQALPRTIAESDSSTEATRALNTLRPTDTTANLEESILLAKDKLPPEGGRIVVLSDFALPDATPLQLALQSISSDSTQVSLKQIGSPVSNVGFTFLEVQPTRLTAHIKNFNPDPENVRITYEQDGKTIQERTLELSPLSEDTITFTPTIGKSTILLDAQKDAFPADNILYVTLPDTSQVNVLLVTNQNKPSFLQRALEATGRATIAITRPPVIPDFTPYDLVIMHQYTSDALLPGTFKDLKAYTDKGGSAVITYHRNLGIMDTDNALPITLDGTANNAVITTPLNHPLTKDLTFGNVQTYFTGVPNRGTLVLAATENGAPVIAIKGTILYYGLSEQESTFHTKIDYPLFWLRVLTTLTGSTDPADYHLSTGTLLSTNKEVRGPDRTHTTSINFDLAGYYEADSIWAANLLSEQESNLNPIPLPADQGSSTASITTQEANMETPLLILGIILLITEWFVLKWRGEL